MRALHRVFDATRSAMPICLLTLIFEKRLFPRVVIGVLVDWLLLKV